MTEVHYRTQIEALKNWKRMVKISCDKVDCSGNCQRLSTLRFMSLGHEVSRALIHLLSLIFLRTGSSLHSGTGSSLHFLYCTPEEGILAEMLCIMYSCLSIFCSSVH